VKISSFRSVHSDRFIRISSEQIRFIQVSSEQIRSLSSAECRSVHSNGFIQNDFIQNSSQQIGFIQISSEQICFVQIRFDEFISKSGLVRSIHSPGGGSGDGVPPATYFARNIKIGNVQDASGHADSQFRAGLSVLRLISTISSTYLRYSKMIWLRSNESRHAMPTIHSGLAREGVRGRVSLPRLAWHAASNNNLHQIPLIPIHHHRSHPSCARISHAIPP
jgi:hypothetical protein